MGLKRRAVCPEHILHLPAWPGWTAEVMASITTRLMPQAASRWGQMFLSLPPALTRGKHLAFLHSLGIVQGKGNGWSWPLYSTHTAHRLSHISCSMCQIWSPSVPSHHLPAPDPPGPSETDQTGLGLVLAVTKAP